MLLGSNLLPRIEPPFCVEFCLQIYETKLYESLHHLGRLVAPVWRDGALFMKESNTIKSAAGAV